MNRKNGKVRRLPASSSTTSDAVAVEEVRQAIRVESVKGLKNLGINPDLRLGPSAVGVGVFETSSHPYTVIDRITSSATPSMYAPTIIPNTPISMVSTCYHVGNGGKASGFLHLLHDTHDASPLQIFGTIT